MNSSSLAIKPQIAGILNLTPDSFFPASRFSNPEFAVNRALQIEKEGASIIDIGAESTRPGAEQIDLSEELSRAVPVLKTLKSLLKIPLSIDTYKAETAEKAILEGTSIINDISALRFDPGMVKILKKHSRVKVILMHMKGTPQDMQVKPFYVDVIKEISEFFEERIDFCQASGISKKRIIIDPGIGFGKRFEDNIAILKNIEGFKKFGVPVMLGTSRKSFFDGVYPSDPEGRLLGTLATTAVAFYKKIDYIRVHDVLENSNFLKTLSLIED